MNKINRPAGMTDFESILKINDDVNYNEKWHTTTVGEFEKVLKTGSMFGLNRELRKNMAYSLVYLQYLQLQLKEVHLSSVLEKMIYKTYIITVMGILEGVFYHLVKSNNFEKKTSWLPIESRDTNVFKVNQDNFKYQVVTIKELTTPRLEQMNFEYLINKVQEKRLISLSYKIFPRLKELKRKRNKVHLQIKRYDNDTDYLGFNEIDYIISRRALYSILTDKNVLNKKHRELKFLDLDVYQKGLLAAYLKDK